MRRRRHLDSHLIIRVGTVRSVEDFGDAEPHAIESGRFGRVNQYVVKTIAGWLQALTVGLPGFPPTWMFGLKTLLGTGLFTGLFAGAMKLSEAMDATEPEPEAEDTEEDEAKPSDPSPEPV